MKAYARLEVWLQLFLAVALDIGKDITKMDGVDWIHLAEGKD